MIKIKVLVIMMFYLTLGILVVGCSSETEPATEDENIIVIKSVLQQQFTFDQELVELFETMTNESTELVDDYLEEKYKSYFTENMYNNFIRAHAMHFYITALRGNSIFNFESVDVKQNESTEGAYDFTVNVIYKKGNEEEKQAKVFGRAHIYEQGKISNIDYMDDSGLTKALDE